MLNLGECFPKKIHQTVCLFKHFREREFDFNTETRTYTQGKGSGFLGSRDGGVEGGDCPILQGILSDL